MEKSAWRQAVCFVSIIKMSSYLHRVINNKRWPISKLTRAHRNNRKSDRLMVDHAKWRGPSLKWQAAEKRGEAALRVAWRANVVFAAEK